MIVFFILCIPTQKSKGLTTELPAASPSFFNILSDLQLFSKQLIDAYKFYAYAEDFSRKL